MIRSKLGFKALGLCALVLGLMGISAGAAQAEAGANWKIKGANVTAGLSPSAQIKEIEGEDATLLSKIAGIKVEILCKKAELVGAKLEVEGKVTSGGKVKFIGCLIKLNGTTQAACEPHNGAEKGVVITNAGKGLLVLHSGAGITRIEPVSGETLVTVATSEECAIGEKIPIIGKLTLKDSALKTEAATHLIVEGPLTELWTISKTEEHKATIDGSAVVELAGEHKGALWSGQPG